MRLFYLVVCFLLLVSSGWSPAQAQQGGPVGWVKRMAGKFFRDTLPPDRPRFLIYPTLAYSPETSLEIGLSGLLLFHAKNDLERSRLSEVQLFGFGTLRGQYGLWLDNFVYGHDDRWLLLGQNRFQYFPLLYYGIGPVQNDNPEALIDATYIKLRQRAMLKLVPNLFGGLEVDFQHLYNTRFNQPEEGRPYDLPRGAGGTTNLSTGAGLVYDTRRNPLNTRDGLYGEVAYLRSSDRFVSQYSFSTLVVDARVYRPMADKQVLAGHIYGMQTYGNVPFNQLALMGGEIIQRGFYAGRYRDQSLLAGQVEYRFLPFPLSKRFGGAVFASAGAVAPSWRELEWRNVQPTGGLGLRYLLYPKKDIFLRFDLGFTRQGTGFYIFTGESF